MKVNDDDDPNSSAWATKFRIVSGDVGGFFNISTGPGKQEGIITTAKVHHDQSPCVLTLPSDFMFFNFKYIYFHRD